MVFYFRTRRVERSIPRVFGTLADLIELIRWGLPATHELTANPYLLALTDEYTTTIRRLQRSFVAPRDGQISSIPAPLPELEFWEQYRRARPTDQLVAAFRSVRDQAREASGLDDDRCSAHARAYEQYREWLPFHCRRRVFLPAGRWTASSPGAPLGR